MPQPYHRSSRTRRAWRLILSLVGFFLPRRKNLLDTPLLSRVIALNITGARR